MENGNVQTPEKEEPRDEYSEYYIVGFDVCQELIQGEMLKSVSNMYDFTVKTFVTQTVGKRAHTTRVIVRSTNNEQLTQLSNEDANLLLPCSSSESRYQTFIQQGRVAFGRRLQPGTEVHVSVKEGPWNLNDEFMTAVVRYKGELPSEIGTGTFFGLELTGVSNYYGEIINSK